MGINIQLKSGKKRSDCPWKDLCHWTDYVLERLLSAFLSGYTENSKLHALSADLGGNLKKMVLPKKGAQRRDSGNGEEEIQAM